MINNFDKHAKTYELDIEKAIPFILSDLDYYTEYKISLIAKKTYPNKINSFLDFGCGTGKSINYIRKYFPDSIITGYDPSKLSLDVAAIQFKYINLISDSQELSKMRFDCILVANVFHHIPLVDRIEVMHSLKRCLNPKGFIIVFEHNPYNPVTRHIFNNCEFDKDANMLYRLELYQLGVISDLKIIDSAYTLFFPKQIRWLRWLEPYLSMLPLGAQYFVRFMHK